MTLNANRPSNLITAPGVEPITLDELKEHLRLDTSSDDTYLTNLITASREYLEGKTWIGFIEQTRLIAIDYENIIAESYYDGNYLYSYYGSPAIELPLYPLISVESIVYYDKENSSSVFDSSNYQVDIYSKPGRVYLNDSVTWPTNLRARNSIEITYKVGFGATAASCPNDIKQALLIICADWYENRQTCDMSDGMQVGAFKTPTSEASANKIISKYRMRRI